MARTRVSTTVDEDLLANARRSLSTLTDAALLDQAVVVEPPDDPVPTRSSINLDSIESVWVAVPVERVGRLSDERMREVCTALAVAVDCHG